MTGSYKKGGAKASAYYIDAMDDYYASHKGGEPPGIWYRGVGHDGSRSNGLGIAHGKSFQSAPGADTLHHETEKYQALIDGLNPESGAPLVQNPDAANRVSFHDFTLSAPKSVSVIWSQATGDPQTKIQDAQHNASVAFLDLMSSKAYSRQGKGGYIRSSVPLNAAMFHHGSSRADDPQLHTHNVVFNLAERPDGTTGALETREMMSWQGAGFSLYHAELAYAMRQLGFTIEKRGKLFEVAGVPSEVRKAFSQRREEVIEGTKAKLIERGMDADQAASAVHRALRAKVTVESRKPKGELTLAEIRTSWTERGTTLGFTEQEALALRVEDPLAPLSSDELLEEARLAVEEIAENKASFKEPDILTMVAIRLTGRASGEEILRAANAVKPELLVAEIRDEDLSETRYTTRKMFFLEREMMAIAGNMAPEHKLQADRLVLPEERDDEQRRAVIGLATDGRRVSVLEGTTGTGKSFTMASAARSFEAQGYTVVGLAAAHEQAKGLAQSAGIEAHAITGWSLAVKKGRAQLDDKTVMIVDEAGMIGAAEMHKILRLADERGAKLILLGDTQQQGSVAAGNAMWHIVKDNGSYRLETIRRQKDERDRTSVKQFFDGHAKEALATYLDRGLVNVQANAAATDKALIADWARDRATRPEMTQMIVAASNKSVVELNRLAHESRKEAGELGESIDLATIHLGANEKLEFSVGDDVVFRVNSQEDGVVNRTRGKIESIENGVLQVNTERGMVTMDPSDPKWQFRGQDKQPAGLALQHGYAATVNAAQGATVDLAYVRDAVGLKRDQVGVMFSRHSEECHAYIDSQARWEAKMAVTPADKWHPHAEFTKNECLARMTRSWSAQSTRTSTLDMDQWTTAEGLPVDGKAELALKQINQARELAAAEMAASEIGRIREGAIKQPLRFDLKPFQNSRSYELQVPKPSDAAERLGVQKLAVDDDISLQAVRDAQAQRALTFNQAGDPVFQGHRPDGKVVFTAEADKPRTDALRFHFPVVLSGDPNRVDIVSSGRDALYLRTVQEHRGEALSTVIVSYDREAALSMPHIRETIAKAEQVERHDRTASAADVRAEHGEVETQSLADQARQAAEAQRQAQLEAQQQRGMTM